jgi:hypothetical protein
LEDVWSLKYFIIVVPDIEGLFVCVIMIRRELDFIEFHPEYKNQAKEE